VVPPPHDVAQVPFEQICPAVHELPQLPQFALSVAVDTQACPQRVEPVPQFVGPPSVVLGELLLHA